MEEGEGEGNIFYLYGTFIPNDLLGQTHSPFMNYALEESFCFSNGFS